MFNPDDLQEPDGIDEAAEEIKREEEAKQLLKKEKEEKERGDVVERVVTPEQLQEILISDNFLDALTTAGETTKSSGHETSFILNLCEDGSLFTSRIWEGGTEGMGGPEGGVPKFIKEADDKEYLGNKSREFIDFHFHPDAKRRICPSSKDLSNGSGAIDGIGRIDGKKIKILMMKKRHSHGGLEVVRDALAGEISENSSQEEVQAVLRDSGIDNVIISFDNKNGKHELSADSKRKLKKFGPVSVDLL